jgi:hypothetical protein
MLSAIPHLGLVTRVPGYRLRGPGFDSWIYRFFIVVAGLKQDLLGLVMTIEEIFE